MFKCNICGVKVPDVGMKLFISHELISVMCMDRKKHREDWVTNGTCTIQIRLCEKCRKLNDLDIDLTSKGK